MHKARQERAYNDCAGLTHGQRVRIRPLPKEPLRTPAADSALAAPQRPTSMRDGLAGKHGGRSAPNTQSSSWPCHVRAMTARGCVSSDGSEGVTTTLGESVHLLERMHKGIWGTGGLRIKGSVLADAGGGGKGSADGDENNVATCTLRACHREGEWTT